MQDTWKGDPWQPWTQNLYVYVGNSPVNYVDPTGHTRIRLQNIPFTGTIAHGIIEANMASKALSKGLTPVVETYIPGTRLKPDIYTVDDFGSIEVYEIKPATQSAGIPWLEAQIQLQNYVTALGPLATEGTTIKPDKVVASYGVPILGTITLRTFTRESDPGLVYYEWEVESKLPEVLAARWALKYLESKFKKLNENSQPEPGLQPAWSILPQ